MLNNEENGRWLFAASTVGGVLALIGTWAVLLATERFLRSGPLEWLGACSYGLALGAAASLVHVAGGGQSLERAVSAALLGAVVVSSALALVLAASAAGVVPLYVLPLLAAFLLAWVLAIVAFVLVIPATLASVAVFGALHLVRRVIRDV